MADYLYGSGRIRTLEQNMIGRERIERLLDTKNAADLLSVFSECGITPVTEPMGGRILREETLLAILKNAYREIADVAPESPAVRLWLYPYDCNNIKAAIKCFRRGIDPEPMLFDFGTVPADRIRRMAETGDYSELPPQMALAADAAAKALAGTGNPQQVDLLLDRACYADMLADAEKSRCEYALRLVRTKIDLTNVMIAVRVARMGGGEAGRTLRNEAMIPGGYLAPEDLIKWIDCGEETLWNRLRYHELYGKFGDGVLAGNGSLTSVEREADNCWMSFVTEAKSVSFGVEVLIGFLLGHEYEVRNVRIVFAGRDAKLSAGTIRERIRDSYV